MQSYQKADVLNEGKTKTIWSVKDNPALIVIENKKDITAFDDPKFTKQFELKAQYATTTTCRVFELLKKSESVAGFFDDPEFLTAGTGGT